MSNPVMDHIVTPTRVSFLVPRREDLARRILDHENTVSLLGYYIAES